MKMVFDVTQFIHVNSICMRWYFFTMNNSWYFFIGGSSAYVDGRERPLLSNSLFDTNYNGVPRNSWIGFSLTIALPSQNIKEERPVYSVKQELYPLFDHAATQLVKTKSIRMDFCTSISINAAPKHLCSSECNHLYWFWFEYACYRWSRVTISISVVTQP